MTYSDLGRDAVLIEMNGVALTKSAFEDQVSLRLAMMACGSPTNAFQASSNKVEKSIRDGLLDKMLQDALVDAAAKDYADKHPGIDWPSREADVRQKILTSDNGAETNASVRCLGDVLAKLPTASLKAQLEATVAGEAHREAFLRCAYSNALDFSDAAVERQLQRLQKFREIVAATNALAYASATNYWRQGQAGVDFTNLVAQFSFKPEEDDELKLTEEICEADFPEEDGATWKRLNGLKDGVVLPPLDTDRGIEVIKVLKHLSQDEANAGEPSLLVSRLLIRKALTVQAYTAEEYRAEMEPYTRSQIFQQILRDQWPKCRLRCPNGPEVLPMTRWRQAAGFPKGRETKEPTKEMKNEK